MRKTFEIKLTDIGDDTMNAEINVGSNTTPELLNDMIAAFERMREGLYEKARLRIAERQQYNKGRYYPSVQDMKSSIECNWPAMTLLDLEADLALEENGRHKRSSVIQYLQACIKRKRKQVNNGTI